MIVSDEEFTVVWTAKVTRAELFCVPQSSFFFSDYFNESCLSIFMLITLFKISDCVPN